MKIFQVMIFNALILIALGIYGYVISGSPTALISTGIGIVLLGIAFPVKKENAIAAHIGFGITLLSTIMFFVMGIIRGNNIILIMGVVSLIATIFYFSDFLRRKREREANNI